MSPSFSKGHRSEGAVVGVVGVVVDLEAKLQNRFGTRRARNTTCYERRRSSKFGLFLIATSRCFPPRTFIF